MARVAEEVEDRTLLSVGALDDLWQSAKPADSLKAAETNLQTYLRAADFDTYTLDTLLLKSVLDSAPPEFTFGGDSAEFVIPDPDGNLARFHVFESPIMAPELAARFPDIRTYSGQGIDDPAATLRFDVTPHGFHAQILSPGGAWYVDPYYHLNDSLYATYFASSAVATDIEFHEHAVLDHRESTADSVHSTSDLADPHAASHDDDVAGNNFHHDADQISAQRSGTQLRTYRTAVAATGEYTAFHGGTVALGQAAIVTAINRVTGIYENELSVRLELVANNSMLVYTDSGTDPYSNGNASALLSENQTNIDTLIGNANYDIGHVFSTGGGGLAGLGVVGIDGQKARGETGLSAPVNDVFYVDYVAHEIGHQFGGNHTFNGDSGNCAGGNRNAGTAYEPGSGSTIQAYAGICSNDNLQANSDPYFHSISFDEMINHVDNVIPAVGTRTSTGNTVPTVNAGSDFTIPARTAFSLTAFGSDADGGDVLTYNWEERDLGPQQDVNAGDNGSSPLFRSFTPTINPTRTFPRLSDLLNNTTVVGETLPTTTRTLNFRATVRDNRAGGGGVNSDDSIVSVVDTGAAFAVTSPNSAVAWTGTTSETVTWNVAGTTTNGIDTANVNILLSTDGGLTFPVTLLASTPNDGIQNITVPDIATSNGRIRVEGAGNIFFDLSDADFTIIQGGPAVSIVPTDGTTLISESGATDTYDISLTTVPAGAVEITAAADSQSQVSIDGTNFASSVSLTFTDMSPQTVTVRAIDDALSEGPHTSTVSHAVTATGDAGSYPTSLAINDITASIDDNELLPFTRSEPFGGLASRSLNNTGSLANSLDEVELHVFLQHGQTLTALAEPSSSATLSLELVGVTGMITAAGAGQSVVLPATAISADGTYVLRVTADVAADFRLDAFLNTAFEGQVGDTSDGNELPVDSSAMPFGSGRFAVEGVSEGTIEALSLTSFSDPGLFVDISGTGTALALDDDGYVTITTTVGNPIFPAGSVTVSNNGAMVAAPNTYVSFQTQSLPTSSFGTALLPFWADIHDTTGNVFWEERQVGGIETLIVQWDERPHYNNIGNATFQVQLFASGPILARYAYQDVDFGDPVHNSGASATIGYQDSSSSGIQFSRNTASVANGDVIDLAFPRTADVDEYTVDLTGRASESIDILLAGHDGADFRGQVLELLDTNGTTVLATGKADPVSAGTAATNFDLGILDFTVPADGIYTLRVSSTLVNADYGLLVTAGLAFDVEPNNNPATDSLRDVTTSEPAAGFLNTATDQDDFYAIHVSVGQQLLVTTATPLDNPLSTPLNSLNPELQVVAPDGSTIVATDTDSGSDNKNAQLTFTALVAGTYTVRVRASSGAGEYLLTATDAADETLTLVIADASISENGGATTATVTRSSDTTDALIVNLISSDTGEATVPATVTIDAGQSSSAAFPVTAVDDAVADGPQTVTITAFVTGHSSGTDSVQVTDDEVASLMLTIAAPSFGESDGPGATTATVSRDGDTSNSLIVTLSSSDTSEAVVPAVVTIQPGQTTSPVFNIDAVDDAISDGTVTVTITASAASFTDVTDTVDVTDDEGEIHGVKWHDINGNGLWDGDEPVLPGWTIYLDQNNNGFLDTGGEVEPDNFPGGTVLNTIIPDVTLTAVGPDAASPNVTASPSSATSTGPNGFANDGNPIWGDVSRRLRMDFTQLVSSVSIDYISDDSSDIGRLQIFDTSDNILGEYITGNLSSNVFETMTLTRPTPEIAYAIAGGFDGQFGRLDNLSFGLSEASTVTDGNGEYWLTNLPAGTHTVREVQQDGWSQTAPIPPPATLLITEINLYATDWIEIQNVSDSAVDTTGWQVVVSDAPYTDINTVNATTWSLPGSMAAGAIDYRTDSAADQYWGSNLFWNPGPGGFTGWAMILDDQGAVIDWVGWGWNDVDLAAFNVESGGFTVSSLGNAWAGPAVDNVDTTGTASGTLQRTSIIDQNNQTDWSWGAASKGTLNPGLATRQAFISGSSRTDVFDDSSDLPVKPSVTGNNPDAIRQKPFSLTDVVASIAGQNTLSLLSDAAESLTGELDSLISIPDSRELFSVSGTTLTLIGLLPGVDPLDALESLAALSFVDWVSPNYIYQDFDPRELIPNDVDFPDQYHHPVMQNELAWNTTLGSPDVIIGVTDDGIDWDHVDLAANIWSNGGEIAGNGIDDDNNGYIDDVRGWDFVDADNNPDHNGADSRGTHVAGIAAGDTNNGVGIAGTAGGATILPLKFYDSAQTGSWTATLIAETYAYAIDNGAKIVNTSYNVNGFAGDPIYEAGLQYYYDMGGLHLNSAGNATELNPVRQSFDQSLFVSSTTNADTLSGFSNYGTGIDIAAPGSLILSTLPNDAYGLSSGTSMSTPNAAGVAALIWSAHPAWTRDQVAAQLIGTVDNIDALNPGFQGLLGSGRVNSFRAVTETLAAPQIEQLMGVPADGGRTASPVFGLAVNVANVFDPGTVNDPGNWNLTGAGIDRLFGTADDVAISLTASEPYQIGTNTIPFRFSSPLAPDSYRFTAISGGVADPFGTALDGNGDGTAGDDFIQTFTVVAEQNNAAHSVTLSAGTTVQNVNFGNQHESQIAPEHLYLNEILIDPTGGADAPDEYIELRGPAGQSLENTFLVFLNGEAGPSQGEIRARHIVDLSGMAIGSNGFLAVVDATGATAHSYAIAAGTTIVDVDGLDFDNASYTAVLLHRNDLAADPVAGQDLDTGNDGLDTLPSGWSIVDSVSVLNGDATDRGYANIVFSSSDDGLTESGAAFVNTGFGADGTSHVMRIGDSTGSAAADWVAFRHFGNAPDFTIAGTTNVAYAVGSVITDHVGQSNPTSTASAAFEFGDAPSAAQSGFTGSYPVTLADDGARHVGTGASLGPERDVEADGVHSLNADADDATGATDDEDGVIFAASTLLVSTVSPSPGSVIVDLQNADDSANRLDAWIDWNQDGVWGADEQIFDNFNLGITNGPQNLVFQIPQDVGSNVLEGTTYARFRLSAAGNLNPTGAAMDGEVEDYAIQVANRLPLVITEIMFDPDSPDGAWEWIEVYNGGSDAIDLNGFLLDDSAGPVLTSANISGGIIPGGSYAVLFDSGLTTFEFGQAWRQGINLIPVDNWPALNNPGDQIGLWADVAGYGTRDFTTAVDELVYADHADGWPNATGNGASFYLTDVSSNNNNGSNWEVSQAGAAGAYNSNSTATNSGADIGSPGVGHGPAAADFVRLAPFGSLISVSNNSQSMTQDGVIEYSMYLEGGQTLSAVVSSTSAATLSIELVGSSGVITGTVNGSSVFLPSQPIPVTGTYTLRIKSDATTDIQLDILKNAVFEAADSQDGSELPIDSSLLSGATGGRWAALGVSNGTPDVDEYTVDLTGHVGELIDVILTGIDAQDMEGQILEVLGTDGTTVLATGSATPLTGGVNPTNADLAILDFPVPADGVYTVRINASLTDVTYSLVVTYDITIDAEPNNNRFTDPLRTLSGNQDAIGYLEAGIDDDDYFTIDLAAGEQVAFATGYSLHPLFSPIVSLDPELQVFDPTGSSVALDLDSGVDGRNAELEFSAAMSGTYVVRVGATSGLGEYLLTTTITDVTPPTLAITRDNPLTSPTNADTLTFRLTFSEDVMQFDLADLAVTGPLVGSSVLTPVSASEYTLELSAGDIPSYNGLVGIDLSSGQNITDVAGNPLSTTLLVDETYLLDNLAPIFSSITRLTPATNRTDADSLIFRLTFNEDVLNVSDAAFEVTGTTATITSVVAISGSQFDLTVSGNNLDNLNGVVGLDLAAGQGITDVAGNALPNAEPDPDETYTVINLTPPTGIFLNEILIDPDGASDNPTEYIEIRGTANQSLAGVFLVLVESDSGAGLGRINTNHIVDLTGTTIGSNGFLTIVDATGGVAHSYPVAAGTTVVDVDGLDFENASYTAFLIHHNGLGTDPVTGQDLDVDDNGLDTLPTDWTLLDGVSVLDGGSADRAYADIVFSADADGLTEAGAVFVNTGFGVDDVTHVMRIGNSTGSTAADWVAFDHNGTAPDFRIGDSTDPAYDVGSVITDHLGEVNPVNTTLVTPVISATPLSKVYDGNTFSITATADDGAGGLSEDSTPGNFTFTYYAAPGLTGGVITVPSNAGSYSVDVAYAGNSDYAAVASTSFNLTIVPAALTASASAADKVYDASTTATVTVSLSGVIPGDTVMATASGTFDDENVGSNKTVAVGTITLAGTDSGNYTVSAAPDTTADITAAELTSVSSAADKVYDATTDATVTISLSGVIPGDTVTATASGTFDNKNVGTNKTVTVGAITLAGTDSGNYTVSAAPDTTADITAAALTAVGSAADKVYDATTDATVTISLSGVIPGDTVTASGSGTFENKNVGTNKSVTVGTITLAGTDSGNYSVSAAPDTTADITAAALTSVSSAADKVYDATTDATVTISLSGVIPGDTVTATASGTFDNKNVGTNKTVTVGAITLAGTDSGNYVISAASNTTADITAASLTADGSAADKVYDATADATVTISLSGVIPGDTVTATASGTFDNKNVGMNKTVTVGAITLAGTDFGNYTVSAAPDTTGDITAASLTAVGTAADKVYDATTDATVTISLSGVIPGDTVTATASGTFDNKNVGTNKTVTVGTITLAGTDFGNYVVSAAPNTTADISAAALSISANAAGKTIGNADPALTFTAAGFAGGEDSATALSGTLTREAGETVGIYQIQQGSLAAINGNYTIHFTAADFTIAAGGPVNSLEDVTFFNEDAVLEDALSPDQTGQRSIIRHIQVVLDGTVNLPLGPVSDGSFILSNPATGGTIGLNIDSVDQSGGQTTIVLSFTSGASSNGLLDGNYELLINGGTLFDADGSGTVGGTKAIRFHRLFGDTDGDRDVDGTDYANLYRAFYGEVRYQNAVDRDGDNDLFDELSDFFARFGTILDPFLGPA